MDPFITLFFDLYYHYDHGDAMKLYYYFVESENSGIIGAVMTVLCYFAFFLCMIYAFYFFTVYTFMSGRIFDYFSRISSNPSYFVHLPHDFEWNIVSLRYTLNESRNYLGRDGSKRAIFIQVYENLPEELHFDKMVIFKGNSTTTTALLSNALASSRFVHVAIFTVHLSGERELLRHFMQFADGRICELFEDGFSKKSVKEIANEQLNLEIEQETARHHRKRASLVSFDSNVSKIGTETELNHLHNISESPDNSALATLAKVRLLRERRRTRLSSLMSPS
jgi:hypothetical protein